jgi:hypothetical protein
LETFVRHSCKLNIYGLFSSPWTKLALVQEYDWPKSSNMYAGNMNSNKPFFCSKHPAFTAGLVA